VTAGGASRSWLRRRVAIAIALTVSFYALALTICLGLLWIAYADVTYTSHPIWRLVLFCLLGAGSILFAIAPRVDRFDPPGPRVTAAEEPALFAAIESVAATTSQAMPEDVYVVNAVNAFVTQRGGVMGIGSRRVMGIGLPLMQTLTVDEFKSVLAHEFGHYHAGDVALGPWIYKTRTAIGRTIERLSNNVLQRVFVAYGNLFLRITHAVSRRQEFVADEVAAHAVGGAAIASGLRKVHGAAFAHQSYWATEVAPVLESGHLASIAEGFSLYLTSPLVASSISALVVQAEAHAEGSLYDTHPSLRERVAALALLPQGTVEDARPAVTLLRDIDVWERRLLVRTSADYADLKQIPWSAVAMAVYVPMWRHRVLRHGQLLGGCTMANVPATRAALVRIGGSILQPPGEPAEALRFEVGGQLLVSAIGDALVPLGWTPELMPGRELILRREGHELRPFSELSAVVGGNVSMEQWRERCTRLGIADVVLGTTVAPADTSS